MKKIILTIVAMLSMTSMFAEESNSVNVSNAVADKYVMNINSKSLSRALGLDYEEANDVEAICKNFSEEMQKAGSMTGEDRDKAFKKAVNKNLSYMHAVLSNDQYRRYVTLLNVTINNRGLNKEDK